MEWYTYITIALINAAILIWTAQRCAPINKPKMREKLSVLNLVGVVIVSSWCIVYGSITESLIVKEVSTALFVCTLIAIGVHIYRAHEHNHGYQKKHGGWTPEEDEGPGNIVDLNDYRNQMKQYRRPRGS
jgi:hypothetical protein